MPARLIAYLPEQAALSRLLRDGADNRIGRGAECEVVLADPSVSRLHACLLVSAGTGLLRDQDSKNGTYVDGQRVSEHPLVGPCWLRFGDVHCEYEPIEQSVADQFAHRLESRRAHSQVLLDQLGRHARAGDLAAETLKAIVELAECERGALLMVHGDQLRIHATLGIDPERLGSRTFAGSVGALERALATREPVVINDVSVDPELRMRNSVVDAGLRTLICLPMLVGADLVGIAYAESTRPGAVLTQLDTELLGAFVERAALWLAARTGDAELARLHNAEVVGFLDLLQLHAPPAA